MTIEQDRRARGVLARLRRLFWASGYCRECQRLVRGSGPTCAGCAQDGPQSIR